MSKLFYLDTNAIVRLIHTAEKGHLKIKSIYDDPVNKILISELAVLETVSSLRKKMNTGEIDQQEFFDLRAMFDEMFCEAALREDEKVLIIPIESEYYYTAGDLVVKHNLRTLDAIQLQAILPYKALSPVFVSADNKLAKEASKEFDVVNLNDFDFKRLSAESWIQAVKWYKHGICPIAGFENPETFIHQIVDRHKSNRQRIVLREIELLFGIDSPEMEGVDEEVNKATELYELLRESDLSTVSDLAIVRKLHDFINENKGSQGG